MTQSLSRRAVVKTLGLSAAATLVVRRSVGNEPARLDVKDPAAVAVGYVENAARVDIKKYPSYVQGSNCENCLQLQGKAGDAFRPCTLFKGKLVAAAGWCTAWTPEM
jgi:hypothetical protein